MADELKDQQEVVIVDKESDSNDDISPIDDDIIPIDSQGDDSESVNSDGKSNSTQKKELKEPKEIAYGKFKFDKKLIIIAISSFVLLIILIIIAISSSSDDPTPTQPIKQEKPKPIVPPTITQKFQNSKIDSMLIKANKLYESGNKIEALKLYENIALYNESLSKYNLGVSKMNQGLFQEAIETFKDAISNSENITVSAINIAVCALEIGDEELFKYYIDLANAFINRDSDVNLYEFYNA